MRASLPEGVTFTDCSSGGAKTVLAQPVLICAWCDQEAGVTRLLSSGVSHGICGRHQAIFEAEIVAMGPGPTTSLSGLTPAATDSGFYRADSRWRRRVGSGFLHLARRFFFFSRSKRSRDSLGIHSHAADRGDRLGRLLRINGGVK